MNLPDRPGQNRIGRKAASVVAIDTDTGQNIRFAAATYASLGDMPSAILRSAYSVTTMAPSISMPSPSSMPNITMKLNVKPKAHRKNNANRNDTGMAAPTMMPLRAPIAATTSTMTSTSVVTMLPCSSVTWDRAKGAESCV